MSVNCVYCGHVNPDGSTVCLSCGRTLPPAPSSGAGSYGQQPPQSWGSTPPAPPGQPSSYPPPAPPGQPSSYPPPAAPPYGGSYPPPDQGYGQQPSFGNPPPPAPSSSFGNAQGGYGASSYPPPPTPSFGQAPAWGGAPQAFGAANPEAQSAKQMAIIALVVSCLALVIGWCCYTGLFLGPTGAILGFVAKGKLSRNNSSDGQGLALGAIVVGAIAFFIPIVIIVLALILGSIGH